MEKNKLSSHFYRNLIFGVGITATICYRSIIILNHYSQFWVSVVWYIGTMGFIWYFAHRYRVENKREKLIEDKQLGMKIKNNEKLTQEDRDALVYVLRGLRTSKARWNYIAIFVFSILALVYAVYVDFINPLFG